MTENVEAREIVVEPEDRLIPLDFDPDKKLPQIKALTQKGKGYPERFPIAPGTAWESLNKEKYKPQDFTAKVVFDHDETLNPGSPEMWADPADPTKVSHPYESYEGPIRIGEGGRPLNPKGPTGIEGRGVLGKWGANRAVDAVVTRINDSGQLEMIIITRVDTEQEAIPGGMLDKGETVIQALGRELGEETFVNLDFKDSDEIYKGYVDDPRNTDNSWMETDAHHLHLSDGSSIEPKSSTETKKVEWKTVDQHLLGSLYASHAEVVKRAISKWQEKTGKIVNKQGFIGISS